MRHELLRRLALSLAVLFGGLQLHAAVMTDSYIMEFPGNGTESNYINMEIAPKNCNLTIEVKGAMEYKSYFISKSGYTYILENDGWNVADSSEKSDAAKLLKSCSTADLKTDSGTSADSLFGSSGYISSWISQKKTSAYLPYSYIPLSSQISSVKSLTDAAGGTFIVSALDGSEKAITIALKPDFDLYNNEYALLDGEKTTEENQYTILDNVFRYQAGLIEEDEAAAALVTLAEASSLPQFIAESFWNMESNTEEGYPIYDSIDIAGSGNGYLKRYLEVFLQNQLPILYSDVYLSSEENYSPSDYEEISADEGKALAQNVLKYLDGANAYRIKASDDDHKEGSNPVPYAVGGIDTPESFNKKMETYKTKYGDEIPYMYYVSDDFKAGDSGAFDYQRNAGCDGLGMLTGAIGMTDAIRSFVFGYEENPAGFANYTYSQDLNLDSLTHDKLYQNVSSLFEYKARFDIYDIEKITEIVPYYEEIREGDILVNNRDTKVPVAVVTGITRYEDGTSSVKDRSGVTVTYIEEKPYGTAVSGLWSDLEESGYYTVRRLLKKKQSAMSMMFMGRRTFKVGNQNSTNNEINFLLGDNIKLCIYNDTLSYNGEFKVSSMYEEDASDKIGKWKWIPNTGEYLVINFASIEITNKSGILLPRQEYDVSVTAKDRNFKIYADSKIGKDEKDKDGNIYNNTVAGFEVAFAENGNIAKYDIITNSLDSLQYSGTLYYNNSEKSPALKFINEDKESHFSLANKSLGKTVYIRPENINDFRPGNDLILGFTFSYSKTIIKSSFAKLIEKHNITIYMDDNDYIDCYDKKALWRANLYLYEGKSDWNIKHPWNAPVDLNDNSKHTITLETAKIFGCNEWNKKIKTENELLCLTNKGKPSDFEEGDGEQVVSLPNTNWYHGHYENFYDENCKEYKRSFNTTYEIQNNNCVPYDYYGWDDPFSFAGKMEIEKRILNKWYNSDASIVFGKSEDKWPSECKTIDEYRDCLGNSLISDDLENTDENLNMAKTIFEMYKNDKNRYQGGLNTININKLIYPSDYGAKLKSGSTSSYEFNEKYKLDPMNYPKFFDSVTKAMDDDITYIPGLSDALEFKYAKKNSDGEYTYTVNYTTDKISSQTAGVDCVGFVQGSLGYSGNKYKVMKESKATVVPTYNGETNHSSPYGSYFYNENKNGSYEKVISRKDVLETKKTINKEIVKKYTSFANIVPGDIIMYSGHVMIVSSIDDANGKYDDGTPYWNDASSIHIIESTYNLGKGTINSPLIAGCTKSRTAQILDANWSVWRLTCQ